MSEEECDRFVRTVRYLRRAGVSERRVCEISELHRSTVGHILHNRARWQNGASGWSGESGARGSVSGDALDQYYTNPALAERYVSDLAGRYNLAAFTVVEPSAGAGAFSRPLAKVAGGLVAIDLDPVADAGVSFGDFLGEFTPPKGAPVITVGNPPFGFAANTAIRFFNKAAGWSEIIAFIVPKSFRKASVVRRLAPCFVLVHDEDVPKDGFLVDGIPYDVPCAWQVWERRVQPRQEAHVPDVSELIRYVADPHDADFALRRVGGNAGKVMDADPNLSPTSTYFIRDVCGWARDVLTQADWSSTRDNTAGVRSVAKSEIAEVLATRRLQ